MRIRSLNSYSEKIRQAYEKNIFYLPLSKVGHFFERAYKITGDKKYENIIAGYMYVAKPAGLKNIADAIDKGVIAQHIKKQSRKRPTVKGARQKIRESLYASQPRIVFYDRLMIDLLFVRMMNLDKTYLKKEYKIILSFLRTEDFQSLYVKEDVLIKDSSFAFNTLFILKHLGICNHTSAALSMFRSRYFTEDLLLKKKLPKTEFKSLIYSLTHIIIADSKFYDRHVTEHSWIIEFFAKEHELIREQVTLDILAEVAWCFRLTQKDKQYQPVYKKLITYILKQIHLSDLKNVQHIIKKEHTNSILMMLLSKSDQLYKGPDLSGHSIFTKYYC